MPFRETFDCLWCGRHHATRTPADLEGFAQLCPGCVGRAQENPFLRYRLRAALEERASAGRSAGGGSVTGGVHTAAEAAPADEAMDEEMRAYYAARAGEYDDWYLRRGRYSHGPIHDQAWGAELDAAGRWLDGLPLGGEIVELAAGTGWWSPLLAQKGQLSIYDAVPEPLDRARERLLAHGLRAHIHVRDAWDEPDRQVDGLFVGFWLSHVPRRRLPAFLRLARRWLRTGGTFAFIDSRHDPRSGAVDHERDERSEVAVRRTADGQTFRIPKIHYGAEELEHALLEAGFAEPEIGTTGRFFLLGRATAGPRQAHG